MGVNAQTIPGNARGDDIGDDGFHLTGQGTAVCVAQHNPTRARVHRGLQTCDGIVWVRLITIEKMFRVKQRLAPLGHTMRDRGRNRFDVFIQRDAQGRGHVKIMCFTHQTHRWCARVQNRGQHIIIFGGPARTFGHAKCGKLGVCVWTCLKKCAVGWVCAGPAPFDVINAKIIQRPRECLFFVGGKLHPLGLLSIAQGGVVDV